MFNMLNMLAWPDDEGVCVDRDPARDRPRPGGAPGHGARHARGPLRDQEGEQDTAKLWCWLWLKRNI